jgi:anaerobic selenocysteine-containing dehydrogenase
VADALKNNKGSEIAFLMGTAPDHLFDLVSELAKAIGAPAPLRFGGQSLFEGWATLTQAAQDVFGQEALPFFDIGSADLVLSFGAPFLGPWFSQVAFTRAFSQMRKGTSTGHRGTFVQFEPRLSQTAARADHWIPIKPGTEGMVALALGRIAAEIGGGTLPQVFSDVDVEAVSAASNISVEKLQGLGQMLAAAKAPLAIPGGGALAHSNGLETAKSVLALNAFVGNLGQAGGVSLTPLAPGQDAYHRPASLKEMNDFVDKAKGGAYKVLFVHGANPLFELPKTINFDDALKRIPSVISFATFPDETAMQADYIFPDHHGLESWGYQRVGSGSAQPALSGAQPVVVPFHNTRATVDVLLAAVAAVGGNAAAALAFKDEVEFVQSKLAALVSEEDGYFSAPEINTFAAFFQQYGGWWKNSPALSTPSSADVLNLNLKADEATFEGAGEFFLAPFLSPTLGDNGANKPWLQELADPNTTVMWNTWVEINPETAKELGVDNGDVVLITSAAGALEVSVYKYPAIRPDTIAIPFGQGHTAYGRFAEGRGVNPADLLVLKLNEAGDLAFAATKVKVEKTGKTAPLSRLEGALGVYGFDAK